MELLDYRWYARTTRTRLILGTVNILLILFLLMFFFCAPLFRITPDGSDEGTSFSILWYWLAPFFSDGAEWYAALSSHGVGGLDLFLKILFAVLFIIGLPLLPLLLLLQLLGIIFAGVDTKIYIYENYLREKYQRFSNALGNNTAVVSMWFVLILAFAVPFLINYKIVLDFFIPQTLPHTLGFNVGWLLVLVVVLVAIIVLFKICNKLLNKQIIYVQHDIKQIIAGQKDPEEAEDYDEGE